MNAPRRPNVLWFISDDTGFDMLGYSGGPRVTPHIDRIAASGVVCTQFHTASPICTPSRYSYFTGRYPGRTEAARFLRRHPRDTFYDLGFENEIEPGDANFGSVFRAGGYRTGLVGKFHVGPPREALSAHRYDPDEDPRAPETARKLREDYAAMQAYFHEIGFDYADGISWDNTDNRPLKALHYHNLEWQTDHALRFIDGAAAEGVPFALHFGFTTQHGPHHVTSLERDGLETEWGYLEALPPVQTPRAGILHRVRAAQGARLDHLSAGAAWMDDAIGAVLRRLEELGQLDNTIIVVSTDHGPGTRNGKFTCYQGGAHIPFCIRWANGLPVGATCDALLQNVDFLPTLCALTGIAAPRGGDGLDRSGQLRGAGEDREELYFELGRCRGVRTARWKYVAFRYREHEIARMQSGETPGAYRQVRDFGADHPMFLYPHYWDADQLYDLAQDPGEQRNLAGRPECAEVLADLRARLDRRLATFAHPYPRDAHPWQGSAEHRALARRNLEDRSCFAADWYREGAW